MSSSKHIFDSWLVLQYQAGNDKAISLLVNRWHKKLCRHACWYTKDIDSAQDVVQDSWNIILRKLGSLREPDSFGSWAFSIVTRKSIDWLRKNSTETNTLKKYYDDNYSISTNDHHDTNKPVLTLMKRLINELPDGQRLVLNLFYLEALSIKNISEILRISEGTVKSRLFNAREKLRMELKTRNYEK
jgi:RNA polymerase sigma-70 factor (ECF subfamily)